MMSDVKREMEIMSCRQDLLANEWQRACFSPPLVTNHGAGSMMMSEVKREMEIMSSSFYTSW